VQSLSVQPTLDFDLVSPLKSCLLKIIVTCPDSVEINTIYPVKFSVESVGPPNAYLIQVADNNPDNICITSKNSVVCDFRDGKPTTCTANFELLPYCTGLFSLPPISVKLLDGSWTELNSDDYILENRNPFFRVYSTQELPCFLKNNLFNHRIPAS
jgi:hypothetical protein